MSDTGHSPGGQQSGPSVDTGDVAQELRNSKLEALAEFAAGAGHEINNPLAAISGRAQLLLKEESDPERRRHLVTIGAQALRIRDMIGDVMLFARPPQPVPGEVDLTRSVEETIARLQDQIDEKELRFHGRREEQLTVWADDTQLRVVISELIRNAVLFSSQGATVQIDCLRGERETAHLIVRDHGPGLSDVDREHLFDPFYSGRQAGRGLGFGLSKCWRIVTLHGGNIRPDESDGFAIIVDWPMAPPES